MVLCALVGCDAGGGQEADDGRGPDRDAAAPEGRGQEGRPWPDVPQQDQPGAPDSRHDGPGADGAPAPDLADSRSGEAGPSEVWETRGPEAPSEVAAADCPVEEPFEYECDEQDPADSCPKGLCLAGLCIGPILDPDRWKDCDDGVCGPCEGALKCPADCGSIPPTSGEKDYVNDTTISVWVHGFYNKSPEEMAGDTYGKVKGCDGVLELVPSFGVQRPCGDTPEGSQAPNQFTAVEYYGGVPASWLTPEDIAEIEEFPYSGGPLGLQRYGLIVAKFIRHKLAVSGATHVNIACHSMGCLISRYLIENNVENLAAENRIVRWYTNNGVLAGARLARLFDNPSVQAGADALGLELSDFILMNPDYVQDTACWWDHKLQEGNNPLLAGVIIHHSCATDPKIAEAFGIQLLDLNNPDNEPNDGIQYTFDEFFHVQHDDAAYVTPAGDVLPSSHTYGHFDHMTLPETDGSGVLAAATLFHGRRVEIRLALLQLLDDREADNIFDSEHGTAPAEISWNVKVRYNPYVAQTFGKDVVVHEDLPEYRSAPLFKQQEGQILLPDLVLFQGPVLDEMTALHLDLELLEMDWYPRFGVGEWVFDQDQGLASYKGSVPLVDGPITFESEYAKVKLEVRVFELY
jgi:hypothetical protein